MSGMCLATTFGSSRFIAPIPRTSRCSSVYGSKNPGFVVEATIPAPTVQFGGYYVFNLENGDKIFGKLERIAHGTISGSSPERRVAEILSLTGGTGKFRGIHGTLRGTAAADPKA